MKEILSNSTKFLRSKNIYSFFKYLAFQCDPEFIHHGAMDVLHRLPALAIPFEWEFKKEMMKVGGERFADRFTTQLNDLRMPFPIGLAAGLDKNADAIDFFSRLPFGAIEVGTVTPLAQEGNPKPRLFRLIEQESLRNALGFNNGGMEKMYANILDSPRRKVLGVNLGKNKITPNSAAVRDYVVLYEKFAPVSDYLVINISSPNTPGLRELQDEGFLRELFTALASERKKVPKPLFVKLAPELTGSALESLVHLAEEFKLSGLIATNTTIVPALGAGGISGKLLFEKSRATRRTVLEILGEGSRLDLIGVGGFSSFEDVLDFWKMGGKFLQIYTGFIYQGPQILTKIYGDTLNYLERQNISSLAELWDNRKHL